MCWCFGGVRVYECLYVCGGVLWRLLIKNTNKRRKRRRRRQNIGKISRTYLHRSMPISRCQIAQRSLFGHIGPCGNATSLTCLFSYDGFRLSGFVLRRVFQITQQAVGARVQLIIIIKENGNQTKNKTREYRKWWWKSIVLHDPGWIIIIPQFTTKLYVYQIK